MSSSLSDLNQTLGSRGDWSWLVPIWGSGGTKYQRNRCLIPVSTDGTSHNVLVSRPVILYEPFTSKTEWFVSECVSSTRFRTSEFILFRPDFGLTLFSINTRELESTTPVVKETGTRIHCQMFGLKNRYWESTGILLVKFESFKGFGVTRFLTVTKHYTSETSKWRNQVKYVNS